MYIIYTYIIHFFLPNKLHWPPRAHNVLKLHLHTVTLITIHRKNSSNVSGACTMGRSAKNSHNDAISAWNSLQQTPSPTVHILMLECVKNYTNVWDNWSACFLFALLLVLTDNSAIVKCDGGIKRNVEVNYLNFFTYLRINWCLV